MKVSRGSSTKVITMTEKVMDVVVVEGITREAVETFRACGVKWIRYKVKGESCYATEFEWNCWKNGISTLD